MGNETAQTGHDRRSFIVGATAASVVVAAGGWGGYRALTGESEAPTGRRLSADELEYDRLQPIVGDRVRIASPSGTAAARVSSVGAPAAYSTGDGVSGSSFSMLMESPSRFEQGIYEFTHSRLGTFPMFVVPVDIPTDDSFTYEAVFNRLD